MNTSPWYTPIPVGTVTAQQRALINREIAQRMIANGVLVQPGHRQPSLAIPTGFHENRIKEEAKADLDAGVENLRAFLFDLGAYATVMDFSRS